MVSVHEGPWSKSSLKSLLEGCAWQWALQKVGGLESPPSPQSAAGTGAHAALEAHEVARLGGDEPPGLPEMLGMAERHALADAGSISPEAWGDFVPSDIGDMARRAVAAWWEADACGGRTLREVALARTPVAVEPYFRTAVDGGEVHGYMDWLGLDEEGRWVVVDYKTASSMRRWPRTMPGPSIEAAVYLVGAARSDILPADESIRMEWHVMSTKGHEARLVTGPTLTPDLVAFLRERVETAEMMVANRAFPTKPTWNLCSEKWCDFYHGCQVSGTLSPDSLVL